MESFLYIFEYIDHIATKIKNIVWKPINIVNDLGLYMLYIDLIEKWCNFRHSIDHYGTLTTLNFT